MWAEAELNISSLVNYAAPVQADPGIPLEVIIYLSSQLFD